MMQFSEGEAAIPSPLHEIALSGLCLDPVTTTNPFSPANHSLAAGLIPTFSKPAGASTTAAGYMEQLLVRCADAIESSDATLAQQILWVLNNIAPADAAGDSTKRLTSGFLRALIARASKSGISKILTAVALANASLTVPTHRFSAVGLASFIDLTPWHRFGFTAANAAIVEAVEGFSVVHIVDLSTTHCMQIPTLIDALANRPEGPPFVRLTVPGPSVNSPPPLLDTSYDELGSKLVTFARYRNVRMEFKVIPSNPSDAFDSLIEQLRVHQMVSESGEALVVNCQMMLHCIPDETAGAISTNNMGPPLSLRTIFLRILRSLDPVIVTVVEEDADFTSEDLVGRLRSAFDYLWIPYDVVDTFLPLESGQRQWYEADLSWKIENVIACEGLERLERQETKNKWGVRMRSAGFRGVGFGEEAVAEVKGLLDEHAAGWGLRKEEEELVLTWKGHNVVFATAWIPW